MLKNFWYAVEESASVGASPRKVVVLGQDLVLFRRSSDGKIVALSNQCVHRMGSLAGGTVDGDNVRCPYHGWTFGEDGACTGIPANPAGAAIPRKARVDSYPTVERYGWVWVFLGDLPEAERPPIPPFPEFGKPGWRAVYGEFLWNAHYTRVVENGADVAHAPFVHKNSFGNPENPVVPEHDVKSDDFSVGTTVKLESPAQKGLWKLVRRRRSEVTVTVAIYMPSCNFIDVSLGNGWRTILLDSNIPIDENTTLTRFIQLRNFFTGAWADGDAYRRTMQIFLEDQPTVESQKPRVVPYEIGADLSVKSDALSLAHRRLRKKYIDMGWQIDLGNVRSLLNRENRVVVIPSPRRRAPELRKAWVLDEVPVVRTNTQAEPTDVAAEE
jgi:phenylpropionate dioxygenase-like ring-hydroxylating dioxygenase large terminal subunit